MLDKISDIYLMNKSQIDWLIGLIIILIIWLVKSKIAKFILMVIGKIFFNSEEKSVKRNSLINSLYKPFSLLIALLGVFAVVYYNYPKPAVIKGFKILFILDICWGLVNYLSDNLFLLFHFNSDDDKTSTTVIKFVNNILKIIIIAFAVIMVVSEMGYNINGFITGLGVGGLAISLAAKDAISNLISGFIIVFEKPFVVGDLIKTSNVEGWVEEVQMRSTIIRTPDDSLVTVPNSTISNDAITNISKKNKRLISFDIGLIYSTPNELIEKCRADIEKHLIDNDNIVKMPIRVNFTKFDNSSLNISIMCYTTKTDVSEYNKVLNDLNFTAKEIVESNGAEFAYPTSSVYIENK